jgi:hypothetical protein
MRKLRRLGRPSDHGKTKSMLYAVCALLAVLHVPVHVEHEDIERQAAGLVILHDLGHVPVVELLQFGNLRDIRQAAAAKFC